MKKYESQRGAILVESALIVGAIFLMLFGTVFVAIIGFDQMSADGASFEVAHQTSVGAVTPPPQFSHQLYPNIPQAQISAYLQPAPASSISVDYGYNDANANIAANSDNNRHGGVAVVQGTEVTGTVTKTSASILGMPISVMGGMVEPMWLENGIHFNAENADTYGGTAAQCAPTPTPAPSATATPAGQTPPPSKCFSGNIFTSGENTPPYFIGFNFMTHCELGIPWSTGQPGSSAGPPFLPGSPPDCTQTQNADGTVSGHEGYEPLGVAEYLDLNNWCGSSSSTCSNVPSNPGLAGSKATDATFALIACHQRVYAQLASYFVNHPVLQTIYTNQGYAAPAYYYWYLAEGAGSGVGTGGDSQLADFAGFDSTQAQENANWQNGAVPGPSHAVGATDTLVRQVYSWDASDVTANGNNELNPGNGC